MYDNSFSNIELSTMGSKKEKENSHRLYATKRAQTPL